MIGLTFNWNRWQQYHEALSPWQWGLMIGGIFLAIWLIVRLRSYFREDADDADQPMEMLTQFRDLHQQGGLSDDEFRLIRSRLAKAAQMARVAERTDKKVRPVNRDLSELTNLPTMISRDSSVTHSIANEANSEGMTEEKTD